MDMYRMFDLFDSLDYDEISKHLSPNLRKLLGSSVPRISHALVMASSELPRDHARWVVGVYKKYLKDGVQFSDQALAFVGVIARHGNEWQKSLTQIYKEVSFYCDGSRDCVAWMRSAMEAFGIEFSDF